ncbi:hypothetical protein PMAC_001349 [Pneumocystis sp. 'macacae']|nr:hypothetical protein PMAC_001349 [Pneumocystis sp. 'macacae']
MKVFVLAGFFGIAYAFSKKLIHKRSTSLIPSVNTPLLLTAKEEFFVLILKENTLNDQCQIKLQEYCEKLKSMNLLDKVLAFHPEMKSFCQTSEYKKLCDNFKQNTAKYCEELEKKLKAINGSPCDASQDYITQNECILLEKVCSRELKEKCNDLTSSCQQEERNNLGTEFLLRAFPGDLKKKEDCEKVINEKCLMFIGESDELMKFCLTSNRCEDLVILAEAKCEGLEGTMKELQNFIGTINDADTLKEICISFLKECHLHKSNCNSSFHDVCKELEKKCGEERKYTPPNLTLDLLEKEITLMEEIEHKELFGDEVGKPGAKDMVDLLLLLVDSNLSNCETNVNKCYKFCSSLPQLKDLYDSTKGKMNKNKEDICTNLKDSLRHKCKALKLRLHSLSISDTSNDNDSTALGWSEQSIELDEKLCIDLESECFYLRIPCNNINIKMSNACANLKSSCLKTRLVRRAYQLFQKVLRGKLHNLAKTNFLQTCINGLLELCKTEINTENPILMDFCLRPWDACHAFASDIQRQSRKLRISLGWKRDFPSDEDCKKLEEKCEALGQDSRMNYLPCLTLKERCSHLKNAKELGNFLLKEKAGNLNNLETCIKKVTERCNAWSRRKRMGFALSCIQLNTTCQMITRDINFKCKILGRNMDLKGSLTQVKNVNATIKESACDFWEPYCDVFMSNCKKLIQDNGKDGKCKELKGNCKLYRELQDREKEIMHELRGSLNEKNKCQSTLDKRCLNWAQTNNYTFKNFCSNTGIKNGAPKDKLCEKLIKRIKKRCAELSTKLGNMAIELEKNVKIVKGLNEVAKKALENAKLTLNKQKIGINNAALILFYNANTGMRIDLKTNTSQKNQSGYLQQKDAEVNLTNKEVEVFDAATEALKVYAEVKTECENLLLECGFKDDCSEYKGACKKIEDACNKLKPLEIKSSKKEATNQTTVEATLIIKTGSHETQKTLIVGGECFSVRETDKWVTSTPTYIQTSTITSTVTPSQCKPTKCREAGDVKSSEGLRMSVWDVMKGKPSTRRILKSSARAVARAVKRRAQAAQNDGIDDEEILLALIVKKDYNDDKCKESLEKYCKELKSAALKEKEIHEKLGSLCENGKQEAKCKGLKEKITTKCTTFKNKLETAAGKTISTLTYDDCKTNEQQCLFLEGACPTDLTEKCNKLRNLCYQKKREKIANEVLLRALRSDLNNSDTCQEKLKKLCPELGRESNELTQSCLDQKETCGKIMTEKGEKCKVLEKDVTATLQNFEKGKCLSLLEQCYFYSGNCDEDMSKCDELAGKCKEQRIAYIPPGPPFDPTSPEASLAEDIGLEGLYRKAEEDGVVIGGQRVRDATALLALLIQDKALTKNGDKEKCQEVLGKKCKNTHEHEALENLCEEDKPSEDGKKKCGELEKDINKTCTNLTPTILKNRLYDLESNGIFGWGELPTFLSSEECARLESYCLYFEKSCHDGEKACMNVRAACYKRGLDARANSMLQREMRGLLHGSNKSWVETFQKKIVGVCKELKEENKGTFPYDELFVLCVQPLKALRLLTHDHQMRTVFLREQLDKKRDFPGDKDCKELGRKCQELEQDSNEIRWPCYTLEQQCERLGTTELLKTLLLSEHKDTLKDEESCNGYLKRKCSLWTRRGDGRFSLVCAFQNATCKLMVDDVQTRCEVFKKNTDKSDIIDFLKTNHTQMESLAGVCPYWHPYCDKYGPNCPDLLKGDTLCASLKKYCEPFYKRRALEDALKAELRGKLSDKSKCDPELKRYCTVLKEVNNVSINSLCEDSTKSNTKKPEEKVRGDLCLKLIAEVAEQCRVLPAELKQKEEDLKSDSKTFDELKKQAEKAMEEAKLVLSVAKTSGDNAENGGKKDAAVNRDKDTMKHVKIVRRGAKDVPVTELEARALDLAADVLARYVELKERCTRLNSDCGIKEDCKTIEGVCKEIDKTCRNLKPLDIRSQKIVTQNVTTTTTKTVGPGGETVEECKVEDDRVECGEGGVIGNDYFGYDLRVNEHGLGLHRQAQQAQNVYEDEDYLLALILKNEHENVDKCKKKLEEYCKEFEKIDKDFTTHSKLKEICENGKRDGKCTDLKNKVTGKCNNFKTELEKEVQKGVSKLTDDDCKKNEQLCLFLEGACPTDLKENCNKLRVNCYQKKRKEVAEDVLLRALSGKLNNKSCKEKLKEVCLELSGESDELTVLCFDEQTCGSLIAKKENVCKSLKDEVEKLLEKENELKTKCSSLLKRCYFYSTDCTKDQPQCKELKSSCKGEGIVYEKPGSDFEPTRPGLTVAEEIELQELYGEAAREGVYIGRPPTRDVAELLLLVSQSGTGSNIKEKCKKALEEKCKNLKEHELLKSLCESDNKASENGTKECDKLDKKEKESTRALTTKLEDKYLVDTRPNTVIGWHGLPTFLTDKDCRVLESDCFYLGGKGPIEKPCSNLRAACYKKGLDAVANEVLQHELRGSLQGSNPTWFEDLQKKLVKACGELKGLSDELFVLCMNPKNTALTLSTDLRMRAVYLQELLNERRDFPTKKDCQVLGKKCEDLGPDSREIGWPCHTLNQHCDRLRSAEQLEEELLKEKTENLDVFDQCVEKLRERCSGWSRRGNRFTLACLAQNVTCRIITKSVKTKCAALDGHMKTDKIVEEAKKDNGEKENICTNWMPYCSKFMSSCENLVTNGEENCKKLEKECETVIKRLELEEKALNELKGSLKTEGECKTTLDGYCTEWKKATNGLEVLCTDKNGKNDTEVREKLCGKLVEKAKKLCPVLERKLTETKEVLIKKEKDYEDIKKKAEKAIDAAKLVLVTTKVVDNKAENKAPGATGKNQKQFKLVKRDTKKHVALKVTEEEVKAFDLVSQAFSLYVELKEICEDSVKKCGFEKECEECKEACKTVRNVCTKLKPLEIKEYEAKIETRNITTTVTSTVESGEKTVGQECKSIQTTDVWVTKTSTHTSTSTSTSTTTSTVTLTSTRRCKPTRCTTGDEAGDVHPSGGNGYFGYDLRANEHGWEKHNVYEDEEYLFALIVKKNYNNDGQCKNDLEMYCKSLKDSKLDTKEIHKKLEGLCEDTKQEAKCKELKTKITQRCTGFKGKLETAANKNPTDLKDSDCEENEQQCLFLEAACPNDLKDKCIELRNKCYQKKRDEVAEEALLRALNGDLKKADLCKAKIKGVCKAIGQENNELLKRCLDTDKTCDDLVKVAEKKCEPLKKKIEESLTNDKLKENGHSLLKECHFYGENCENNKPDCSGLKEKCKKADIVYTPPGSQFNPTLPEPTLAEKIDLKELYEEAATDGVLIERVLEVETVDLLVFLSDNAELDDNKCKNVLKDKCNTFRHLADDLENLCGNTSEHVQKCQKFKAEFDEKKKALTRRLENKQFKKNEIMSWSELSEVFIEYDCAELQSECFYYESQTSLRTLCKNLKAACYKKGLDTLANEMLLEKLRGKLYYEIGKSPEEFPKKLIEACKELKNTSKELFVLCMQPTDTIGVLLEDLRIKTDLLQDHLNENRDLPTRQHCTDLLKKCADLGQDSKHIEWPCRTLRHHCARLGVAEQLEEVFLQEKVSDLDKFESCVKTLTEKCNGWGRRGRTRYALGCVAPNATCTYLTQNVGAKCAVLGGRIQTEDIINKAKEQNTKEATCRSWMPFCNKFMSSCGNLTAEENKYCKGLEKECKTVIRQLQLEKEVIDELKGHLKTKQECRTELDKYCTQWEKAENELKTLCTDDTGSNDKVRNGLCEKLVEQLKKQCPELEKKLTKAKEELEKKGKEYEDIKEKAKKAMEDAKLVLVTTRATGNKSENKAAAPAAKSEKQFKLVRRDAKTSVVAKVTEEEITAFDLVSQALSLYVELKEECQDLLKDCGFKVECPQCEDACKTIENKCNGLKPLEVTEHKDAWVECNEGGVVGDDDFSYDLEMGKYGLGWHVYLGNDECILPGRSPRTSYCARQPPHTVYSCLTVCSVRVRRVWACFGRVWDARVCPKLVRNYPAVTPQKNKICVGCLHGICVDFDSIGGGKNRINGFFLHVKGEQEEGGERCAPGDEMSVCTKEKIQEIKTRSRDWIEIKRRIRLDSERGRIG